MSVRVRMLAGAALLLLILPSVAGGQAPTADSLSERLASRWMQLQRADGSFADYVASATSDVKRRDRYGPAVFGAALMARGIRTDDSKAVAAALAALRYAAAHPDPRRRVIFENVALASAYNDAREQLAELPAFVALRPVLERRLRRIRFEVFGTGRTYSNLHLVEAVAILELLRTGLTSNVRGSVLAQRTRARKLAVRLLERRLRRSGAAPRRSPGLGRDGVPVRSAVEPAGLSRPVARPALARRAPARRHGAHASPRPVRPRGSGDQLVHGARR